MRNSPQKVTLVPYKIREFQDRGQTCFEGNGTGFMKADFPSPDVCGNGILAHIY
jgi:hypothetical protein